MPTTVMMPPPVAQGYPVRCPGTDGIDSHIFYITTKPKKGITYCCPKCYSFLPLDRVARDVSRALKEDKKPEEAPPRCPTDKSIDELLKDVN